MLRRHIFGLGLALAAVSAPAFGQHDTGHVAAFDLYIDDVYSRQTGGESFAVSFRDPLTRQLNPVLRVREGDAVVIHLTNRSSQPHAFAVMSVKGADSASIPSGGSTTIRFTAPGKGSYIYHDPLQASAGGAHTLFGDFIVAPRRGAAP